MRGESRGTTEREGQNRAQEAPVGPKSLGKHRIGKIQSGDSKASSLTVENSGKTRKKACRIQE